MADSGFPKAGAALDAAIAPFYHALGRAFTRWQYVESGMFVLTHAILRTDYALSSIVFFNLKSADAKLQLTDKLARGHFPEPIVKSDWKPLHKDLEAAISVRNKMAHFEVNFITDWRLLPPGEPPVAMTPHHLDVRARKGDSVGGATTTVLREWEAEYLQLSKALLFLTKKHFDIEALRANNLPPQLLRFLENIQTAPQSPSQPPK